MENSRGPKRMNSRSNKASEPDLSCVSGTWHYRCPVKSAARHLLLLMLLALQGRAADLTTSPEEIIEFRQQRAIGAVHPDRLAYFGSKQSIEGGKMWMFAPFPSYSSEARQYREQGTAFIIVTIGQN